MTPETSKRLVRALSNIDALRRNESQLDEDGRACLARCIAEFDSVTGRTAAEAFIAWRNQGSPYRDPRPREITHYGDALRDRARHA
jgi:hypothetical protein